MKNALIIAQSLLVVGLSLLVACDAATTSLPAAANGNIADEAGALLMSFPDDEITTNSMCTIVSNELMVNATNNSQIPV